MTVNDPTDQSQMERNLLPDSSFSDSYNIVAMSRRAERLKEKYSVADIFLNAQRQERVRCLVCLMLGQRNNVYTSDGGFGNFSLSDFKKHVETGNHKKAESDKAKLDKAKGKQVVESAAVPKDPLNDSPTILELLRHLLVSVDMIKDLLVKKLP